MPAKPQKKSGLKAISRKEMKKTRGGIIAVKPETLGSAPRTGGVEPCIRKHVGSVEPCL